MKKIDWPKLGYSIILGMLISLGIILLSILVVLCVKLICQCFELGAVVITFILLVIGLTYWIYKEES